MYGEKYGELADWCLGVKGLMTNTLKKYKIKSWKGEDIIFIFFICYPVAYFCSLIFNQGQWNIFSSYKCKLINLFLLVIDMCATPGIVPSKISGWPNLAEQNRRTAKRESNLLITILISDRIGRQEGLLPINQNYDEIWERN